MKRLLCGVVVAYGSVGNCMGGDPSCGPACNFIMGCTPTNPPVAPLKAQFAFSAYSDIQYSDSWNVWAMHGFWGPTTGGRGITWFDNRPYGGSRYGLWEMFTTTSGWINQPVLASPAPSSTTVSINSIDMHDGYNASNVAPDQFWVQTCPIGACDGANCDDISLLQVASVSGSGPYTITFTVVTPDQGPGPHVPIVGKNVEFGAKYCQANPTESRTQSFMQLYDPGDLAKVVQSTLNAYDPVAYANASTASTSGGNARPISYWMGAPIINNTNKRWGQGYADSAHDQIIGTMQRVIKTAGMTNVCPAIVILDMAH